MHDQVVTSNTRLLFPLVIASVFTFLTVETIFFGTEG